MAVSLKRKRSSWERQAKLRAKLLGESFSKARSRMIKSLILKLFTDRSGHAYCFRCGDEIEALDFHIDHKEPWQQAKDPVAKYFDVDNLALSHASCNSATFTRKSRRVFSDEERQERHRVFNRRWKSKLSLAKRRQS